MLESGDNGATFMTLNPTGAGGTPAGPALVFPGVFPDKEMIATGLDPVSGQQALYATFRGASNNALYVGGWTEDASSHELTYASFVSPGIFAEGFFPQPVVGPNGQLFISYDTGLSIDFVRAIDGLWGTAPLSSPMVVWPDSEQELVYRSRVPADPNRGIFTGPVIGIDPSHDGTLYIAFVQETSTSFPSNPDTRIEVTSCSDPEFSNPVWTQPVIIDPAVGTTTQFLPSLSVDPISSSVNVLYYSTEGTGDSSLQTVEPRLAVSIDGGVTWTNSVFGLDGSGQPITSNMQNYDTATGSQYDYLEYIGLSVYDGTVLGAWASTVGTSGVSAYFATGSFVGSGGNNVLAVSGSDNVTVSLDPSNTDYLKVTDTSVSPATVEFDGLASSMNEITINENVPNSVALTVDGSNGNPIPTGGLDFPGGAGATLKVIGLPYGALGPGTTSYAWALPASFVLGGQALPSPDARTIDYGYVQSLEFDGGAGDTTFTVDAATGFPFPASGAISFVGGAGTNGLDILGNSTSDNVMSVDASTFTLNGAVIAYANVQRMGVTGGTGNDTLTLASALPFTPQFAGGLGSDTLNIEAGTFAPPGDVGFGSASLTVNDNASVVFSATQNLAALNIGAGASAILTATATPDTESLNLGSLTIGPVGGSPTGWLDLGNNMMRIAYGASDPIAAIRAYLVSGYNSAGALWTGDGIQSSSAAANPSAYAVGYADSADGVVTGLPANTILVMYTRNGDATLNGTVNFSDLVDLSQHYNDTGASWDQGDFNYNGTVDFPDLVALSQNYGQGV